MAPAPLAAPNKESSADSMGPGHSPRRDVKKRAVPSPTGVSKLKPTPRRRPGRVSWSGIKRSRRSMTVSASINDPKVVYFNRSQDNPKRSDSPRNISPVINSMLKYNGEIGVPQPLHLPRRNK